MTARAISAISRWHRLRLIILCGVLMALFGCSDEPRPVLPALPNDALILAFGDSLTRGNGAGKEQDYPAVLQRLSGLAVINAGVPGEESEEGVQRLPELLRRHAPDLLILCHGGNDMLRKRAPERTESNLRRMIQMARQQDIAVVLIGVPKPGLWLEPAPLYSRLAREYHLPYLRDVLSDILGEQALKADPIHPNSDGYRTLATALYALLKTSGAVREALN